MTSEDWGEDDYSSIPEQRESSDVRFGTEIILGAIIPLIIGGIIIFLFPDFAWIGIIITAIGIVFARFRVQGRRVNISDNFEGTED